MGPHVYSFYFTAPISIWGEHLHSVFVADQFLYPNFRPEAGGSIMPRFLLCINYREMIAAVPLTRQRWS